MTIIWIILIWLILSAALAPVMGRALSRRRPSKDDAAFPWCDHCHSYHSRNNISCLKGELHMQYLLSMERHPGMVEVHGWHLGSYEPTARQIVEEKMRTCRENDWPMRTMALVFNGQVVDVIHRDGKWSSELEPDGES